MRLASQLRLLTFPFSAGSEAPHVQSVGDDEIHVWLAQPQGYGPELQGWEHLLAPDERERMARFRFEEHRHDYLYARSMLRMLLGAYLAIPPEQLRFSYSEHGKPRIASHTFPKNLQFNLSHTKGAVLLALSGCGAVGADIEAVREDFNVEEIASRFFSIAERRQLMELPETDRRDAFFRCWTRKEALLKAKGGGLSLPLEVFDVSLDAGESRVTVVTRPEPQEAERWQILPVLVPAGYAAAVAVGLSET